jgi:hypothetical protein
MRSRLGVLWQLALLISFLPLIVSAQSQSVRHIPLAQSGPLPTTPPMNANADQGPEFDSMLVGDDNSDAAGAGISVNRTISAGPGIGMSHHGSGKAKSNPELAFSIDGPKSFSTALCRGRRKSVLG